MKDTEVHTGLPEKEVRDFFQQSNVDLYAKEMALGNQYRLDKEAIYKNPLDKPDFGYLRRTIKQNELELAYAKESLAINQSRLGLSLLMKDKGWEGFDMSEYVGASGNYFRHFIGTKEEYDNFIKQFEE